MVDLLTERAGPRATRAASMRGRTRSAWPAARPADSQARALAPSRRPAFRKLRRAAMSDDDTEAFLRDVRAALAASPRPEDPSLEALQRIATWLRTPIAEEAPAEDRARRSGRAATGRS